MIICFIASIVISQCTQYIKLNRSDYMLQSPFQHHHAAYKKATSGYKLSAKSKEKQFKK